MDLRPLRPFTWAFALLLFIPVSLVLQVAVGPGVAVFAVAAGGSHFKRWTEALKTKGEAAKNGLQGITG